MRLRALRLWMLLVLVCGWTVPQVWAANQSIDLNSGWKFRQVTADKNAVAADWLPAQVPGDADLDLLRNKLIPDPFYGDNESHLQWMETKDWEYETSFPATSALLNRKNIELVFEGLDTCAQVYLNGQRVLTSDNMFRTYRVDAKPYLKSGANMLRVLFPSPIGCADKIAAKDPWRPETRTPAKDYIRQAGYEYGWDWGPRYVLSGIWQPVRLEAWNTARISDLHVRQMDVSAQVAHLLAQVEVNASADTAATVDVSYSLNGKAVHLSQTTQLHPGVNHVDLPITVDHPALWYPAGYGAQPMYAFHADIKTGGAIQDTRDVKTGLRSVVLRREPDQWGRTFEFVVNGIPVFAKGANVIPFDSFPNRVTDAQMRQVLQSTKDANMNMVRVWGGGYYPPDSFFEMTDEMGIMVWQDFMFGNPWMPGTYSFKQNMAAEATDQLLRLRNHPSLVLWCGNNEQESNYGNDSRGRTAEAKMQMWQDYLTEFSGILPTLVARYSPETPYWPSTPSADYEETKDRNYVVLEDGDDVAGNYESGDTHDYSVWDSPVSKPKRPWSSELDRHYRFISEYGFQSIPDLKTLEAYTTPEDRVSVATKVMMAHQKAVAGPGTVNGFETMHDYLTQYYGQPKDLAALIYGTQVQQAEVMKLIAEHLRADRPHAMGSLYWQLNDCWPGISSSSIDYFGRWKALQYYARRFYAPVLVYPLVYKDNLSVAVISDKTAPLHGELRVRVMQFDGKVLYSKTEQVTVPALAATKYLDGPVSQFVKLDGVSPNAAFVAAEFFVNGKLISSNMNYLGSPERPPLPETHLETKLTGSNGSYTLRVSSKVLARSVYVSFGDTDATVSDNYFDIFPGDSAEIHITSKADLATLQKNLNLLTVNDAFTQSDKNSPLWGMK